LHNSFANLGSDARAILHAKALAASACRGKEDCSTAERAERVSSSK